MNNILKKNVSFNSIKCLFAFLCAISIILTSIPSFVTVNAVDSILLRPDLSENGNYTIIGSNESADVTFSPYGGGISSALPTIKGQFSNIPSDAEAIAFYFDFSDSVYTGVRAPWFEIAFYRNSSSVWVVNKSTGDASTNTYTNRGTDYRIYSVGPNGYSRSLQAEPEMNKRRQFAPTAGTVGYVVIPISEEILSGAVPNGVDLSTITEIRFKNVEWAYGGDFQNTKGYLRDLAYITDLEKFEEDFEKTVNYYSVIDEISKLNISPSLDDSEAILNARDAYGNTFFKEKVSNYERLVDIEERFGNLTNYSKVIDEINNIGEVDEDSFDLICTALNSYMSLDNSYKAYVTNYDVLENAISDFCNIADISQLEDIVLSIPDDVTLDSQAAVTIARNIYDSLDIEEKISFDYYDTLLSIEVKLENLFDPQYYGDDNYVVIGKNHTADFKFGSSKTYTGITENLPTLTGDFTAISTEAVALAFAFDYTDCDYSGNADPIFQIFLANDSGNVWEVTSSTVGSALRVISISSNGLSYSEMEAPGRYRPRAGSKGYVIIPLSDEILANAVEGGLDLSSITKVNFVNREYVYGVDFREKTVSLRDLGYIKNVDQFIEDYSTLMDFSAVTNGVEALSSEMTINSKSLLDEYNAIYDRILPSAKKMILNYDKLLSCQLGYKKIIDFEGVISKINSIGEVDSSSLNVLADMVDAYDSLDNSLKDLVTNYDVLTSTLEKFYSLQTAETVSNYISNLDYEITRDDYSILVLIRDCYDKLPDSVAENVVGLELLEEKEADLDAIIPLYRYSIGNYIVLSQNEQATKKFNGTPGTGTQFSGTLPSLSGDCSFVPDDAVGLVFWYDFTDSISYNSLPYLFQKMNLCAGSTALMSVSSYYNYAMCGEEFEKISMNGALRGLVNSTGYVVIPITDEMKADGLLAKVNTLTFTNPDWLYGTGFIGSTVHLRNFGYIKDLYDFEYAVRQQYLERYLVNLQPDGDLEMKVDDIAGDMISVSWEDHPDAYNYGVTVYDKNGIYYTGDYFRRKTEGKIYNLNFATEYYVQVVALDTDGKTLAVSNSVKFTTLEQNKDVSLSQLLEADDMYTNGYLIEGTSVSIYWDAIDGVEYFTVNLYTEDANGDLTYIYSERKSSPPMQVTFLLLDPTENYVAQLVAYDPSDSIVFAYQPDRFTLSSESTYVPESENLEEDGFYEDEPTGRYVTEIVQETVYETVMVDEEIAGKGKWVRKYDWVLNKTAIYIYIGIAILGVLLISAGIFTFIIIKRKKKKARSLQK